MAYNNKMYYFPNNQGPLNPTQLNKDSQIYQPNNAGWDMQMMNGMGQGNNQDWSTSNQRKLDRNSTVFIPGKAPANGNQPQQQNYQNQPMAQQAQPQKRPQQPGMASQPQMAQAKNMHPQTMPQDNMMRGEQWQKMQPQPQGARNPNYPQDQSMNMREPMQNPGTHRPEIDRACQLILLLRDPVKKYDCHKELNHMRDQLPELAPILWYSTGTVTLLLQEIINIYPFLTPPTLSQSHSDRICNVLGLFQCLALHHTTKPLFVASYLHMYLYPLINKMIKQRPFEHLRITSLGVIGALVKTEDPQTINALVNTELIVLCLRIMKKGNELARTVSTFIVQKILMDQHGLNFVCQTDDRLRALLQIFGEIIEDVAMDMSTDTSQRLLRHTVRCLARLSEEPHANQIMGAYIPECMRDPNTKIIKDEQIRRWHLQLLQNLEIIS